MQVVNFSCLSYLALLLAPVNTLAARLIRPAAASQPIPPARAPLAHQRLTLPFARAGGLRHKHNSGRVSSFNAAALESKSPALTRLKVVREQDAAVSPAYSGRMTISGRMADVCAELDRMAQCEVA